MTDDMKIHWKLYKEWFPNEKILSNFDNPIKSYLTSYDGKIIDIGCGQSAYLLDLLESNLELYAVDTEKTQLKFLSDRVDELGFAKKRINYSSKKFPSKEFLGLKFSVVILSNILHFSTKPDAQKFIKLIDEYCQPGTLLIITVHSSRHLSNQKQITEKSYFKSFYSRNDLYEMFPENEFEYLSYIEKEKEQSNYKKEFIKAWINEVYKNQYLPFQIKLIQDNYLKSSRTNSINLVIRKK